MSKKEKLSWLIIIVALAAVLFTISFIVISILGHTYTIKYRYIYMNAPESILGLDDIKISVEDEGFVEILDKKIDTKYIYVKIKSIPGKSGTTSVEIASDEALFIDRIYVHKSGIITKENFFGDCTGDFTFSFTLLVLLGALLCFLIRKSYLSQKKNLYDYSNIATMGLIIFVSFAFLYQTTCLGNYQGILRTIENIYDVSYAFSLYSLPFAVLMSLFVTISNIVLLIKEGRNLRNLLGTFIGFSLIAAIIFPIVIQEILYNYVMIPELHNESNYLNYVITFLDSLSYHYVVLAECILLGTIIICIKAARHIPAFNKDYIIILGCKMKKDGTPTKLLQGRVDRAVAFSEMQKNATGKDIKFVPSGGKGSDEPISESECMKNYLIEKGIPEADILAETNSTNTYENIKFSYNIIREKNPDAEIAFSTTNYHVMRAGLYASEQGIEDIEGIGSKTKSYFWINAFFREFIATVVNEKKLLLFVMLFILLFNALITAIYYVSYVYLV